MPIFFTHTMAGNPVNVIDKRKSITKTNDTNAISKPMQIFPTADFFKMMPFQILNTSVQIGTMMAVQNNMKILGGLELFIGLLGGGLVAQKTQNFVRGESDGIVQKILGLGGLCAAGYYTIPRIVRGFYN